jgi:GTPase SAR1 family protein
MIKVIFWGRAIGKTSLIERLVNSDFKFCENNLPTGGVDLKTKKIDTINFSIWELSSEDNWSYLTDAYLHNVNIAFLCFNPRNKDSFKFLKNTIAKIKEAGENCELILIETKSDLAYKKLVSEEEIDQFKKENCIDYHIKTSAKNGQGLNEINSLLQTLAIKEGSEIIESYSSTFLFNAFCAITAISSAALLIAAIITLSIPLAAIGLGLGIAATTFLYWNLHPTPPEEEIEIFNYSYS